MSNFNTRVLLLKGWVNFSWRFWVNYTLALIHQAASILENHDHLAGAGVQEQLQAHVRTMQDHQDQVAALGDVVEVFCKVTANYAPGLFYTYDVPGCAAYQ